jgi:hypothetical protein
MRATLRDILRDILRFLPALVLVALAVAVAFLAADVRSWQQTFAGDDSRTSATWDAPTRMPGDPAGRLLGVGDDVRARRAIKLFEQSVATHGRLDDALAVTGARARAELALAALAHGRGPRAAQAATLLGVLAFGDFSRGGGRDPSQAETAQGDFETAVRAEPGNETAAYDLELLLRSLAANGTRTGPNGNGAAGSTGHNGAGNGTPGHGY